MKATEMTGGSAVGDYVAFLSKGHHRACMWYAVE